MKNTNVDYPSLCSDIVSVYNKVNGIGENYKKPDWTPELTPRAGIIELTRLYERHFWIESLKANMSDTPIDRELKSKIAAEITYISCTNLKVRTWDAEKKEYTLVPAYSYARTCDRDKVESEVLKTELPLPSEELRKHYAGKIDDKSYDQLLNHIIGTLFHTDNDEVSRELLKLWMINTKMKRFYRSSEKFPRNPIWLSIWSEHHSIGKGFFANALCDAFKFLFNANTKMASFKDLNKQFKGFALNNYICWIDENDRLQTGSSDPNTIKNLISEKKVNAERKGIDNDRDFDNNLSFISTTNQRVNTKVMKCMEEDRRLGEIHITGACEQFARCEYPPEKMKSICNALWILCPIDDSGIYSDVRKSLLECSREVADIEFYERLEGLAEQLGWGSRDKDFVFHPYSDKKMFNVHWTTEVKKTYDKLFPTIGGWGTFTEKAENIGFLYYTSKGKNRPMGVTNLDFSKLNAISELCSTESDIEVEVI